MHGGERETAITTPAASRLLRALPASSTSGPGMYWRAKGLMSSNYAKWSDVRARGREADPRTAEEQAAGKAAAGERREAYMRGHQLAEMHTAADVTQAEPSVLGVSQARVSKIEHGETSGIDVVRAQAAVDQRRTIRTPQALRTDVSGH